MRAVFSLLAACLVLAGTAVAAPLPAELAAGLAGEWKGALGYRDYQNNKLYELPVQTRITALPDGVTLLRLSTFADGPVTGDVLITTASLFDPSAGAVTSASLRKGRPAEVVTETVAVAAYRDPAHWTLAYEHTGRDGDSPARIRVTETREGDSLLSVKEVRPIAPADAPWAFRNQTRLERQGHKGAP
jgi:hypothetical protein